MPIDFPASPSVNDTYTFSGKTWKWNGEGWALVTNPDGSITTAMLADSAITSAKIADGTIVNADVSASAEIAVSKLADGTARQLLQTDAAGTGVEWTSNVDIPGTLDVTSAATFDSTISFPLGSAGSPSIYPGTDTNTGFWSPAADTLAVSTGGSERARIDSSGRLLVGTSTARANYFNGTISANFQVEGTATADRVISVISSTSAGSNGPAIVLGKQNSGTLGGNTIVASGDLAGGIYFQGSDGTEFVEAAKIEAFVDGTPGSNDMPGRLVFSTTSDGASSPTEALRITSDRYLRMAASTGGIQFNGDTAAANALDDYEEGTWTPVLRGSGTAGTYELSRAYGHYTKIGRQVILTMSIQLAGSITGGGTGYAQITGLPFQQAANSYPRAVCTTNGVDISTNYSTVYFAPILDSSTSTWYLGEAGDNVGSNDLPIAAFSANDAVAVTISYIN